jgi:tetratricopeptide (TPR) repeat protein
MKGLFVSYPFDYEEVRRLLEQSLAIYRTLGDDFMTALALGSLADSATRAHAYDEAQRWREESLALRRALGDKRGIAASLVGLGDIAARQGQAEEAERLTREGFDIFRELGSRYFVAIGLTLLGWRLLRRGKFAEACSLMEESVALLHELGLRRSGYALVSNVGQAWANLHLGRYEEAGTQAQRCLTLAREADHKWAVGYSLVVLGATDLAGAAYGDAQKPLQESVGIFQELGQLPGLRFARLYLGMAARGLGQRRQERQHLYEALRTMVKTRDVMDHMGALPAVALLLIDEGQLEWAVELYALASRHLFVANSRWFEDVAGKQITAAAAKLPPEVVVAAQERGRARDLWDTAEELLVEWEEHGSQNERIEPF